MKKEAENPDSVFDGADSSLLKEKGIALPPEACMCFADDSCTTQRTMCAHQIMKGRDEGKNWYSQNQLRLPVYCQETARFENPSVQNLNVDFRKENNLKPFVSRSSMGISKNRRRKWY
ncbi:hypothetical protein CDAR_221721 [Caerostris darwini]|uniref:Uncharacterized protein n=1 Tax=Caerostris darwini TaxID=1538125 RepID=A0AAV4WLH1_9ARAC|nr:hypothetical protein CDAR_221721 [Caerostris darwini]